MSPAPAPGFPPVSLADGQIVGYTAQFDELLVIVKDWRGEGFVFVFSGVLGLEALPAATDLSHATESTHDPQIARVALLTGEDAARLRLFTFWDVDDRPVLRVVAAEYFVKRSSEG